MSDFPSPDSNHFRPNQDRPNQDRPRQQFATTHWSMVLDAGRGDSPSSHAALEQLCATYWFPLYAYTRRQGHDAHDAADLTQGFLADLLRRDDLARVHRDKGKFRSFLLASLKHFICNEFDRAKAQKRGGHQAIVSIDFDSADNRYRHEPSHTETPDLEFQKQWARTVLDKARALLQAEYHDGGKSILYDRLKSSISGTESNASYREISEELEMSEGAVKVAVHRLRQRFRTHLRSEIANTLTSDDDIDDEIQALFEALRS